MNSEECDVDMAREVFSRKVAQISKNAGPAAIAAASSARSCLETVTVLNHFCRKNDWRPAAFFADTDQARLVKTAVSRLEPQLKVSLRDLESSDFILAVGTDPINEAPMLAMAMRQAQRSGAEVVVLDPRSISLPFAFRHLPVPYGSVGLALGQLIKDVVDPKAAATLGEDAEHYIGALSGAGDVSGVVAPFDDVIVQRLRHSKQPIIICGTEHVSDSIISVSADFALLLCAADKNAGVFYVMSGANAFAGGMLCDEDSSLQRIVEDIENGSIRALILAETDPFWHCPDRQRLERALDRLDLLVVFDYLNSPAAQKAHVFLPTATIYEAGGIYVNQEGRAQFVPPAFPGGTPVSQISGGNHPPRAYDAGMPGSQVSSAWLTLAKLLDSDFPSNEIDARESIWKMLTGNIPELEAYASAEYLPEDGVRLGGGEIVASRFSVNWSIEKDKYRNQNDDFELVLIDWTLGTEELSSLSACLVEIEQEPGLVIHGHDARSLGIADGDFVELSSDSGCLQAKASVVENMASGIILLPRHPRLPWQIFAFGKIKIKRDQIRKRI